MSSPLSRSFRRVLLVITCLMTFGLTACKDRSKIRSDISDMHAELLRKRQQLSAMERQIEALTVRENNASPNGGGNSRIQELEARIAKLETELEQVKTEESVAKQAQVAAIERVAAYKAKYQSNLQPQ